MRKRIALISLSVLAAAGALAFLYLLLPAGTTAEAEELPRPAAQGPSGDLTVVKTAMPWGGVEPGGVVTYSIMGFWSDSSEDAPGVCITDTLPAGVTFISSYPHPDIQDGRQLVYEIGTVTPGMFGFVQIVGEVDSGVGRGTVITNTAAISGDVEDTDSGNNEASAAITVQTPKPDLWVFKWGLLEDLEQWGWSGWMAEKGAEFNFEVWYLNWGASAADVVLTDTLPAGVEFVSADGNPSETGDQLVWNLGKLGSSDLGQITVKVRPTVTGTFTNRVDISTSDEEDGAFPNHGEFSFQVVSVLAPRITHPSPPSLGDRLIVGPQPRFEGLARAGWRVILYDGPDYAASWGSSTFTPVLTAAAAANRSFSGTLSAPLDNGDHYVYAKAISGTEESAIPLWPLHLVVSDTLPVDPESLSVEVGGQTYSPGGLGGGAGGTPGEPVTITVQACCDPSGPLSPRLVISNTRTGEGLPSLEPVDSVRDGSCYTYTFRFVPPSTPSSAEYDMQLRYTCGGQVKEVPIIVILIDPAGYVYDRDAARWEYAWPAKPPADYRIVNATVTCTVRTGDESWDVWDAATYDQHNPQVTDDAARDGVAEQGYYAFFVPAGQYKIVASASGCADYESPILTVIDEPIYHNVGMRCTLSVSGVDYKIYLPAVLRNHGG